mmetsp:Transcript_100565/g.300087  ORF Transcript_100565/g.300087 Transcript_100565/m.300087 type:complete len:280 (+) Transcript_100565:432-1271(+)
MQRDARVDAADLRHVADEEAYHCNFGHAVGLDDVPQVGCINPRPEPATGEDLVLFKDSLQARGVQSERAKGAHAAHGTRKSCERAVGVARPLRVRELLPPEDEAAPARPHSRPSQRASDRSGHSCPRDGFKHDLGLRAVVADQLRLREDQLALLGHPLDLLLRDVVAALQAASATEPPGLAHNGFRTAPHILPEGRYAPGQRPFAEVTPRLAGATASSRTPAACADHLDARGQRQARIAGVLISAWLRPGRNPKPSSLHPAQAPEKKNIGAWLAAAPSS